MLKCVKTLTQVGFRPAVKIQLPFFLFSPLNAIYARDSVLCRSHYSAVQWKLHSLRFMASRPGLDSCDHTDRDLLVRSRLGPARTLADSSSDLTRDASIRYASDSITVVLGYQPVEVLDRSCWDYFHPQELPFARSIHGRGVRLDKAAVLNYCSIRHKDGSWVCCECVFTVVYDVLIASTTVYGGGKGSQSTFASGFPYITMLQPTQI